MHALDNDFRIGMGETVVMFMPCLTIVPWEDGDTEELYENDLMRITV